jgi:putative PEP-CTERM system histidine kinase
MSGNPFSWAGLGEWTHLVAAFGCILLAVWTAQRKAQHQRGAMIAVLGLSAIWSLLSIGHAPDEPIVQLAESCRNLALLWLIYRLFARDGRHASMRPVLPVIAALAFVEMLQPPIQLVLNNYHEVAQARQLIFHFAVMFRLLVVTGALVLVHNLYVGAGPAERLVVRWTCAALTLLFGYELNLYTVAYLGDTIPAELTALRGLVQIGFAALLAIGAARGKSVLRFSPSRAVAFQSLSLLVIGGYLIVMVSAAQSLAWFGGNAAQLTQLGFALFTTVVCLAVLPSGRLRAWLKVTIAKHFFQHRYDYRAEWLRFTRTIGRGGESALPLQERVVQAMADITDSPAGLLLGPAERGDLMLVARWQWRTVEVPAEALSTSAIAFLERNAFIIDLDEVREGIDHGGEAAIVPQWLRDDPQAWALVPLIHYERLVGVIVLTRPPIPRKLDWEDFDLLKVVGQQLASYLAEHSGQEALLDASRFDEFNRRIAFVMHDIKNLASQLSLLSRNAERHADKPEFRADMLVTLRNSADKLNALIARLSRYGANPVERLGEVDLAVVAQSVVAQFAGPDSHPVYLAEAHCGLALGNAETIEQVLIHLVQNAIDASPPSMPVILRVAADGLNGCVEVIDTGSGMSAEFVRNRLFKPFVSSKPGGFGIGAFEARELVRAMNGQLDVESRESLGSRFVVRLPLAAAAPLMNRFNDMTDQKVA